MCMALQDCLLYPYTRAYLKEIRNLDASSPTLGFKNGSELPSLQAYLRSWSCKTVCCIPIGYLGRGRTNSLKRGAVFT